MSFITSLKIEAALDSTYGKGLDLALSGGVFDCKETPSSIEGAVIVSGTVEGSCGQAYQTRVSLDLDEQAVLAYSCDCPAARNYDGMCKHEIALVL